MTGNRLTKLQVMAELVKRVSYDPDTGIFIWVDPPVAKAKIGKRADGLMKSNGYYQINLWQDGNRYSVLAHRLAFFITNGFVPDYIDHINNNPADNRITNLRPATQQENCRNRTSRKGSSSKYLGVWWAKHANKYRAKIKINGKNNHLGYFDNEIDAAIAYDNAAKLHFGEYANLNIIDEAA